MSDDDDLLAAEMALGLADKSAAAEPLVGDTEFAARVVWWEQRLAGLTWPLGEEPSPELWARIAAKLPHNDNAGVANAGAAANVGAANNGAGVLRWKLVSGALAAVAALALFMLAQRPQIVLPPPPGAPIVASLAGVKGSALAVSYDSSVRRLTVAPVQLDPGKGDAELWVIPVGATEPISLGVIDTHQPNSRQLDPAKARLVAAGATLAISLEQTGGSPTGHATGPIVASGKLVET